jgi:tRNA pseudouridine55 synthase
VRLGIVTDTDDAEGEITAENEVPPVGIEELKVILAGFTGVIEQRVPAYSAVKVDGERLYKKARRGGEVVTPIRKVTIYDIKLLDFEPPEIMISVECGGGTYIRSLARDIGEKLGCGAHLSKLTRTEVGPYGLDAACKPDAVGELEGGVSCFIPLDEMLPDLPSIELDFEGATEIAYGRLLGIPEREGVEPGLVKLLYDSELVAIALADNDIIKPEKVFIEAGDLHSRSGK